MISSQHSKFKIICSLAILLAVALVPLAGISDSPIQAAETLRPREVPIATESNSSLGDTGNITITIEAGQYEISQMDEYSVIDMESFGSILNPGEPELPSRTFLIGLPPGAEAISVDMIDHTYEAIPGEHRIMPAPPFASDQEGEKVKWGENEEIYSSENAYPSSVYEYLGMGQMRKYNFARVRFSPIDYYPATGKLGLYRSITLRVEYEISQDISSELLSDNVMDDMASQIIINYPSIKSQYQSTVAPSPVSYNYVIITTDSLQTAIEPLVTWKTSAGYSVNVVTTSWISSNYSGRDLPEKIRNFLIDKYPTWGIEYVLIVGSHSTIPMRYCYPAPSDHDPNSDYTTPTDYYYADLTGNWDSDGDGYFGEYEQDNVDFVPEVCVGRIPVDDSATVTSICQKSSSFEQDSGAWKKKALLLGAMGNYYNENDDGEARTDHAITTEECWNGVLSGKGYSCVKMYETGGLNPSSYSCDHPLTRSNVLDSSYGWPSGYGIVNWHAHGSETDASRKVWSGDDGDGIPEEDEMNWDDFISSGDIGSLDDSKPAIIFSCSCLNGYPEDSNNLGKSLLERGAADIVASTRVSWYKLGWDDKDDGGNGSIDYYFFHYLINEDQKCGDALYNSKVWNCDYLSWDGWSFWQNMFDFCLYGDPSLGTASISPGQPDITVNPPSFDVTLPQNTTQDYTMQIGNVGGAPLSYNISDRETTGGGSSAEVECLPLRDSQIEVHGGVMELRPSQPLSFPLSATPTEIAYDDGEADGAWWFINRGGEFAVRFTPPSYPVSLTTARFCFEPEEPDGNHEYFQVKIYDDDGPQGQPGTVLATTRTMATNWGWYDVDISGKGITITEGDFYIAYYQLTNAPNCEALCADYGNPDGRSWVCLDNDWAQVQNVGELGPMDWMIRCVVDLEEGNNPPNPPSNPSPANHATGVSVPATLSVLASDPDGDVMTVTFYNASDDSVIGVPQTGVASGGRAEVVWAGLNPNTPYSWYATACDGEPLCTQSDTWDFTTATLVDCPWLSENPNLGFVAPGNFTPVTVTINTTGLALGDYHAEIVISNNDPDENPTIVPVTLHVASGGNNPPNIPSIPSPPNHATNVSISANLSWTGGDPDAGDTVTYSVYFGTTSPPPFKGTVGPYPATQSSITYNPGTLAYNTKYYWFIIATDNHSVSTTGPTWNFTTVPPPGPTIAWNCPFPYTCLISPYPNQGRPFLTQAADLTQVTKSTSGGWFQVYYLDALGNMTFYDSIMGTGTVTQLQVGEYYYVVVSDPCDLQIPQG